MGSAHSLCSAALLLAAQLGWSGPSQPTHVAQWRAQPRTLPWRRASPLAPRCHRCGSFRSCDSLCSGVTAGTCILCRCPPACSCAWPCSLQPASCSQGSKAKPAEVSDQEQVCTPAPDTCTPADMQPGDQLSCARLQLRHGRACRAGQACAIDGGRHVPVAVLASRCVQLCWRNAGAGVQASGGNLAIDASLMATNGA
jgi:hypothetical protein